MQHIRLAMSVCGARMNFPNKEGHHHEKHRFRRCGCGDHGGDGRCSRRRPGPDTTRIPDPDAERASVPGRANLSAGLPDGAPGVRPEIQPLNRDMAATGNRIELVHVRVVNGRCALHSGELSDCYTLIQTGWTAGVAENSAASCRCKPLSACPDRA